MLGVGLPDPVEEAGPDDAAAAPDRGHGAEVEIPVVGLRRGAHLREALRVRDHLAGVEGLADVVDEVGAVLRRAGDGPGQRAGRRLALLAQRGERAGEHGLGDAGERDAELESVLRRPASGALLLGLVDDDVDQRAAGACVGLLRGPRR